MTSYTNKTLTKRIERFTQVIRAVLMIFGVGAIVSQLLKIFPSLASESEWNLNFSQIAALLLGIVLFLVGKGTIVQKVLRYSLYSGRERMKRFIFSLPISLTLLVVVVLKLILGYENPSYERMMGEGGFVEYGTTLTYILAFAFSLPIGNYFIRQKQKILGIIYYLLAAFFLFIALEEVSWGQTFFKWDTPDFLEEVNVQKETSLHNLVWFHYSLRDAIIVVSFLGGVSWWIALSLKFTRKFKQFIKYLIPDWYLSSFFITCFILSVILKFQDSLTFFISKDQEFAELILSLGFFLFVLTNYFRQSFPSFRLKE
ncbi:MAG: hypothetical protein MUD14_02715 [Hydrococcus sp. Prado102]|jgi:hypothetical protein|nr:hypothetical protein [Hydrococcus sp. Prado102]